MRQIFYASSARKDMTRVGIEALLERARAHNTRVGITGILLYKGGIFLQLIEGPDAEITALFKRIQLDPRHDHVIQILNLTHRQRIFNEWTMAYRELSELDIHMVNEILSWNKLISAAKEIDNHLILHMLERFRSQLDRAAASEA
jgi:hypothetical protein